MKIRETDKFELRLDRNGGLRVVAKECFARPKSVTVDSDTAKRLNAMSDSAFDGSCIMDLCCGVAYDTDIEDATLQNMLARGGRFVTHLAASPKPSRTTSSATVRTTTMPTRISGAKKPTA